MILVEGGHLTNTDVERAETVFVPSLITWIDLGLLSSLIWRTAYVTTIH